MTGAPARFVRVAVPVAIEDALTYRLRPGTATPEPGTRVVVPLGRRRMTGFVVDALDEPDVAEDALRDVDRVLEATPSIPPKLMELAVFIADYYACPLGEVLKAMHPAGPAASVVARITPAGRLALGGAVRSDRQHAVLALLDEAGALTTTALSRRLGAPAGAAVRDLERRGFVEVGETLSPDAADRTVAAWVLGDVPLAGPVARRTEAGERVRALLAASPEGLTAAEVGERTGRTESAARAVLARLERLGIARRITRRIVRTPSAPPDVEGGPRRVEALTAGQEGALADALGMVEAARFEVLLIEGVTGSGKTEVYLRALERAVALGRTGLYLVPEIAITPLLLRTVRARFGPRTAVLHSALSAGERHDERQRIAAGAVDVVVGARSAVFAPLPRLGLIVVDEEHEASYKQDSQPRYHGRDVAVVRGSLEGCPVVLGSATPSVESYANATSGRWRLRRMPERAGGSSPAVVELVDMREEWRATHDSGPLSRRLREALDATLAAGRQAIILLNRRGWADFVLCRECGESEKCDHCAVTLTVHLSARALVCHYCDQRRDIPARCRTCGGDFLQNVGQGTEQLEATLGRLLPGVPVARLDADVARARGAAGRVLADFEAGRTRVLLGTQMVAKGHDFPGVTLVGVLQADRTLWLPDFRAAERTFQLLTQVAGRSGRRTDPGLVIVQTFAPDHPAIELARTQDYPRFFEAESAARRALAYPPYARLVGLLVASEDRGEAEGHAAAVAEALRGRLEGRAQVLGPAPAPIARIKDRWRFQILVKGTARRAMTAAVRAAVAAVPPRGDLTVEVDVDPLSLL